MHKKYKFLIWSAVTLILSFLFWHEIDVWINKSGLLTYDSWRVLALIYFVLLLSSYSIGLALFKEKGQSILLALAIVIPALLLNGFASVTVFAAIIFLLLAFYSWHKAKNEIDQRIKISSRGLISASVMASYVGFALITSAIAYHSPSLESLNEAQKIPSSSHQFIRAIVDKTINVNLPFGGAAYKNTIVDGATKSLTDQINEISKPVMKYTSTILSVILFLILLSISWIFYWLSVLVGLLLLIALRVSKFVEIKEVDVKAERLIL